jgi:hypothetical protein
MQTVRLLIFLALVLACLAPDGEASPARRIALLIGSPWNGEETVIQNDLASFRQALQKRGFEESQIRQLSGKLDRRQVLDALRSISRASASWKRGEVFLYYTGHGSFSGLDATTARPALALGRTAAGDQLVYWDEIFSVLRLPSGVQLILLPDC